ncbi:alpha/beta hydrolase [Rhodanobacter geophilus]|uniref:Alpha/beta fold hydrolase n=1 Tax=Rhodanobacter geophilus TaxID=3162488 RepID=A0ABV3QJI4_9GAMM
MRNAVKATFHILLASSLLAAGSAWAARTQAITAGGRIGTLKFEVHGTQGRPVILIPGLECGPWAWQQTIADLQRNHVVYAVTLAGFDGVPAPAPDAKAGTLLDRADASLLQLIEQQHIDKPVLVGHSIGGTLSLRFAGEHANLITGVVAVDGLPIYPGMDRASDTQRRAIAAQIGAKLAAMTPAQFKAAALPYMQHMGVIDPQLAAREAPLVARSDLQATSDYMAADMAADYRPELKQADVPILEISPYNAPDFAAAAATSGQPVMSEAQKAAYYQSLLANAPHARVVSIAPARHFVMLDQPAKFQQVLDDFLKSL